MFSTFCPHRQKVEPRTLPKGASPLGIPLWGWALAPLSLWSNGADGACCASAPGRPAELRSKRISLGLIGGLWGGVHPSRTFFNHMGRNHSRMGFILYAKGALPPLPSPDCRLRRRWRPMGIGQGHRFFPTVGEALCGLPSFPFAIPRLPPSAAAKTRGYRTGT